MRLPGLNAVVLVLWEDPNCQHEEMDEADVDDLDTKEVHTLGRVVRVTDTHVVVAGEELYESGGKRSLRCTTIIPVSSIRDVTAFTRDP